jgi:hypothetical protein
MPNEILVFFRFAFAGVFLLTLLVTIYLAKNQRQIFGINPDAPSEGSSTRSYARFLVFIVLAHFLVISAAFVLLFH